MHVMEDRQYTRAVCEPFWRVFKWICGVLCSRDTSMPLLPARFCQSITCPGGISLVVAHLQVRTAICDRHLLLLLPERVVLPALAVCLGVATILCAGVVAFACKRPAHCVQWQPSSGTLFRHDSSSHLSHTPRGLPRYGVAVVVTENDCWLFCSHVPRSPTLQLQLRPIRQSNVVYY